MLCVFPLTPATSWIFARFQLIDAGLDPFPYFFAQPILLTSGLPPPLSVVLKRVRKVSLLPFLAVFFFFNAFFPRYSRPPICTGLLFWPPFGATALR